MKKVNVALVRVLQFCVLVLFIFIVMSYFGVLLLIPLDVIIQLVHLMTAIGIPGILATIFAGAGVGYLCYLIYKIPNLVKTLLDIGVELIDIAQHRIKGFEKILTTVKEA